MNKLKLAFLALTIGVFVSSCSNPEACFNMDKETAKVGETVTFTNCSTDAGKVMIYTGDGKAGEFTNGKFIYTYSAAGTYKVEVSASEDSDGGNSTTISKSIEITE